LGEKKERGAQPASGNVSLPFEINKSKTVTADALQALHRKSEHGEQGWFPLGAAAQFHCGAHLLVGSGTPICSVAHGEVVAARIVEHDKHPWGDTGFVLLRHPLEGNKSIFSLFLHLQGEVLHPDRTQAGWLRRLLLDGADRGKPKWRVMAPGAPTWKDEDKGKFSSANVQNNKLLKEGLYEEEDRILGVVGASFKKDDLYVKLQGQWVKVAQRGTANVKGVSPYFDLEAAAKDSQTIAALKDGKVAILDADKKDGKRRWTVEAGEPIGQAGKYQPEQGMQPVPLVHWSVFSKDAIFPTGSLPEKEFGATDEVKLKELDLNEERGDIEHTKKLIEALDPHKKTKIGKMPHHIPAPDDVKAYYRTPAEAWRSRYLAVKGLAEFALDVDKFLKEERYKSHPDKERKEFKKNTQVFLFWKDLARADEFPQDGKAIFIHPATAVRLMARVAAPRVIVVLDLPLQDDDTLVLESSAGTVTKKTSHDAVPLGEHHKSITFDNVKAKTVYTLTQQHGGKAKSTVFHLIPEQNLVTQGERPPDALPKNYFYISQPVPEPKDFDLRDRGLGPPDFTKIEVVEPRCS